MTSTIKVDTISENTSANGVAVDGVTLKDGAVGAAGTATSVAGVPLFTADSSIYIGQDVSGTDDTAQYNVAIGFTTLDAITTGDSNVAIGYNAMTANTTGGSNISIGKSALGTNTTGSTNIAIGLDALLNPDTESNNLGIGNAALGGSIAGGEYNVAIGNYSLDALTSGDNNTAVGYNAGTALTTGAENTFFGYQAGVAHTTGTRVTAIGRSAYYRGDGENDNTAMGYVALGGNLSGGEFNVAIGNYSLEALTSGDYNTSIGYQSGTAVTTGSESVYVGFQAGANVTTGYKNVIIGSEAGLAGSPSGNLTTENHQLCLGNNTLTNAFIKVDWTVTSDKRDKADIEPLTMGLDFVNKLNPVSYRWDMRSDYENQTPDGTHKKAKLSGGLLAQDVEILEREYGYKVEDETSILTTVNSDGNYGLTYSKFVPILIKAVQELSATVTTLQQEIKVLKGE